MTGSLQVCAGQDAGCEAAVHAMLQITTDQNTQAVLLVDVCNAFNCLNRQVTMCNVLELCPSLAPMAVNTFRQSSLLYVGGETILSSEGTTQGNPLAMAI